MKAIVAMDANRGIGYKGELPWHISYDLKWFRKVTTDPKTGGYLVMGYTTYQKVGLLKDRYTYVLTTNRDRLFLPPTDKMRYVTPETLLDLTLPWSRMWVVGGAKTYQTMLPQCDEVLVTHVMDEFECDVYMPEFEQNFPNQTIVHEDKDFWIVSYKRRYE